MFVRVSVDKAPVQKKYGELPGVLRQVLITRNARLTRTLRWSRVDLVFHWPASMSPVPFLPLLSPTTPNSHATSALLQGRECVPSARQWAAIVPLHGPVLLYSRERPPSPVSKKRASRSSSATVFRARSTARKWQLSAV